MRARHVGLQSVTPSHTRIRRYGLGSPQPAPLAQLIRIISANNEHHADSQSENYDSNHFSGHRSNQEMRFLSISDTAFFNEANNCCGYFRFTNRSRGAVCIAIRQSKQGLTIYDRILSGAYHQYRKHSSGQECNERSADEIP